MPNHDLRVGAIIQARMSSQRLPGKSLRSIAGRPVLQYVVERLQHCDRIEAMVVATSTDVADDPIHAFCRFHGIDCIRGELNDVAGRFCRALSVHPMDAFVRVCGDRPLLDQALVARGIDLFRAGDVDVVTNACPPTFPPGETVEVVRTDTFRSAYPYMEAGSDREHVMPLFYRHPKRFHVENFCADRDYSGVRLVLDTESDARVVEGIVRRMTREHWTYPIDEVVSLYHQPSLL